MENFIKYLTINSKDINWGVYINSIGKTTSEPNETYPSSVHPSAYFFKWEFGRTINEYQVIYITKGNGVFENKYGETYVEEGSIIFLFPNEWHRYKPNKETGWTESYVGFNGKFVNHFIGQIEVSKKNPVIKVGYNEKFIEILDRIFELAKDEPTSFQLIASGNLLRFFGLLDASLKDKDLSNDRISEIISKIRYTIRENIDSDLNMHEIASEYNLSYSYFRKMFKKHTGISPKQYHLQLKIFKAKELLLTTDKSVKEICYDLGFQSTSYFSRIFKQKLGVAPNNLKINKQSNSKLATPSADKNHSIKKMFGLVK
ncbi:MAG: AraC family transcriptional regulator [Flavobacteriales bacterium]|nr:AraC family transcriptional regulator [Flavobacteriales bacterium]